MVGRNYKNLVGIMYQKWQGETTRIGRHNVPVVAGRNYSQQKELISTENTCGGSQKILAKIEKLLTVLRRKYYQWWGIFAVVGGYL